MKPCRRDISMSDSTTDQETLLQVEGLEKHFDRGDSLLDRLLGDTSNPVRAVDGIDFEIREGEVFGLVGESGCGKSTTGEAILQLVEPTAGRVTFDGRDLVGADDLFAFRRRSGIVFQDPFSSLDPRMTVEAIVKQPLKVHDWPWVDEEATINVAVEDSAGVDPAVTVDADVTKVPDVDVVDGTATITVTVDRLGRGEADLEDVPTETTVDPHDTHGRVVVAGEVLRIGTSHALAVHATGGETLTIDIDVGRSDAALRKERVRELLERVGLSADQLDRYPHEFSGGQRQRIGIARALALDPDFLVLDEPTSALDVSVQAQVLNLLVDLKEEFGLTYLIISHDLSVIRHICDRVAVMYLGELVEVAPADELFEAPEHPYTEALLDSVPRPEVAERERDIDPLAGDVPSPRNPPSGCRFRTRCPKVIPPDDLELTQEQYRAIMDLRDRIEARSLTLEELPEDADPSVDAVIEHFFDIELPGTARTIVREALEAVIEDDDYEQAATRLRERYESICETHNPRLDGEAEHTVACHLRNDPEA